MMHGQKNIKKFDGPPRPV